METETKGKDQGPTKEEQLAKPPEAPESIKGPKGPEHSRKHSSPSGISIGEPHFSLGLAPHLQNTMWQVRSLFLLWNNLLFNKFQCMSVSHVIFWSL